MNTKNTFVKKLTALVLCLCMVLPMVTTGFAPMMALLDGIAPQADAAVTEKGKVAFYVPEVIYLAPNAQSWTATTTSSFQQYVENTPNLNNIYAQPTLSTSATTTGTIYFAAEDGFSDVAISQRFVDANGAAISGGSITVGAFSNKTSYGTFSVTAGTSPSLAAATTGCYIEWTVSYTNNAGERLSAIAYTYVYKPFVRTYGNAIRAKNTSWDNNFAQSISWISGVHSIGSSGYSGTADSDVSYSHSYAPNYIYSSSGKGLNAFLSNINKGYVGTSASTGKAAVINSGSNGYVSQVSGQADMYAVFADTNTSIAMMYAGQSGSTWNNAGSGGWFGNGSNMGASYSYASYERSSSSDHLSVVCYSAFRGNLYVDTSRYNNLGQIPNLGIGLMATDDDGADDGYLWYVADATGITSKKEINFWQKENSDSEALFDGRNLIIAGQFKNGSIGPRNLGEMSLTNYEGLLYAGNYVRAITSDTNTYTVKTLFSTADGENANNYSWIDLQTIQTNKSTLRTAVNNAINFMGTLGMKAHYGSHYYDTNFTAWQTFKSAYRAAAMGLTKLDGSVDVTTLASNLNNAVKALKDNLAQNRKIFFDVNYNGIKPNLFVLNNVTSAGGVTVTMDDTEKLTLNGTLSGNGNYATAAFSPLVNTPYRINIDVQSGSLSTNASCLVWEYENANGGQLSPRQNYDIGDAQDRNYNHTFTATQATAIDKAVFWGYKGTSLSVNNYQAYIKIEQGSTNTTYSPAARIATASGTYGDLPDLADATKYPQLQRPGYTFDGWATSATGTSAVSSSTAVSSETLYAIWTPITYKVTYALNGGSMSASTDYNYTIENSFNLPTPTRTGYTFAGWKVTTADGNWTANDVLSAGSAVSAKYGNVTLTAQWRAHTYTVHFDANGGTGSMADMAMTYDVAQNLPANDFVMDGYSFTGWTCAGKTYADGASVSNLTATDGGSVTLVAQWTADTQQLTIDSNGGVNSANLLYNPDGKTSWSEGADATISANFSFDENGAIDIYGNYTGGIGERTKTIDLWVYLEDGKSYEYYFDSSTNFAEFYLFRDGSTACRASMNRKLASNVYGGEFVCGGSGAVSDATWTTVDDATGWYQLRIDQDCGTGSEAVVTAYTISNFVLKEVSSDANSYYKQPTDTTKYIPDPVRGGYTFNGWTGAGVGNLGTDKYYTFRSGDNTLVANWDTVDYTLTYNANGGTLTDVATLPYTAEDTITIASAPTRTGYTFTGWLVTTADGNWIENGVVNPGDTASGMYGNTTLTAQWSKNSYTYTVEHRQMNLDGTTYDIFETETVTLNTEDTHTFAVKTYEGFTSPSAVTVTVDGTGELTIVYNYTRNKYTVTATAGTGISSVTGADEYYYGATVVLNAVVKDGYTFTNWTKDGSTEASTAQQLSFTLGAADVAWTANAQANEVNYTVEHKYEKLDGSYDTVTQTYTAATDSSVTPALAGKEGFTSPDSTQTVTVKGDGTTVVTYTYTRNTYTFTTNVDGVTTPTTYKYEQAVDAPATPTKTGYTFAGWDGTVPTTMPAQDLTVNATWTVNTYTLTYKVNSEVVYEKEYDFNEAVTSYTYTKTGYSISAWTNEPATMPAQDVTATATATVINYDITYDLADGALADGVTNPTKYNVETETFTLNNPTKQGYTFAGWTGTGLSSATQTVTIATGSTENRSYTATWTPAQNTYTVETYTMDTAGNYGDPVVTTPSANTDTAITLTPEAKVGFTVDSTSVLSGTVKADGSLVLKVYYKRNSYTLTLNAGTGVSAVSGGGSYYYGATLQMTATLKAGYETLAWSDGTSAYTAGTSTMPDKALTLTATASPIDYTVTYDLAGGTVAGTNPTSYNVETASITLINPTRNGYDFLGWTGTGLDAASTAVTIAKGSTGNRSYTATWAPTTYTIAYDYAGGSVATANPTTYNIESADITLTIPTKQGYAFAGWTGTGITGTADSVTIATGSTGNRTYTATWTESDANYTVKHYRQALDGSYPESLLETVVTGSTTGKTETAALKSYDGFTAPTAQTVTVLADGTATVEYRYTRNTYKIVYYTVNADDAQIEFKTIEALYEAPVTAVAEVPVRTGYEFTMWDVECPATMPLNGLEITALWNPSTFTITYKDIYDDVSRYPATHTFDTETDISAVPTRDGYTFAGWQFNGNPITFANNKIGKRQFSDNFTLTATWTANPTTYKVETYLMDTTGAYPTTATFSETKDTVTDAAIAAAHEAKTGFTADADKSVLEIANAAFDGSSVLKLYYSRNQYTLTLEQGTGIASVSGAKDYYYQQSVTVDATLASGYDWEKWTKDDAEFATTKNHTFEMPAEALTLKANATLHTYNINIDLKNGAFAADYTAPTSYTVTDADIAVANPTRTGYTFNGWLVNGSSAPQIDYVIDTATAADMTLVASWTAIEYTITYNLSAGGVNAEANPDKYTIESDTITLATPTRTGYKFIKWTEGDTIAAGSTGDKTFTAEWEALGIEYDIVYHYEGFTADNYDAFEEGKGSAEADSTVSVAAIAVAKTGFTFKEAKQNDAVVNEFTVSADGSTKIHLYYTRNSYTVTFDTDGGSAVAAITDKYNKDIIAPADPTKEGYTFTGWSPAVPAKMPAENMTLTAQWEINQYTVTFANTGDSTIAPITQDYATDITAPADPTKTGYTFAGWDKEIPATMPAENMTITAQWTINQYTVTFNTDGGSEIAPITQDYATAITKPADPTKEGYTFVGWDKEIPATMPAENVTITAQWTINQYTLTFNTDGGTAIDPITQDYATDITKPADPTKTGYTFDGWDVAIPDTMPAGDMTITAKWKINQYTITFDSNGGSAVNAIKQDYNTTVTAPTDPTRSGYTFAGWDKDIPTKMPAEDMTVTATWEIVTYAVSYELGGGTNNEANPDTYTVEQSVTLLAPTKVGYTFEAWSPSDTIAKGSTGDKTFTATWTPNSDTAITVNYYIQPVDGSTELAAYTLHSTDATQVGTSDADRTVTPIQIDGFTAPAAQTKKVNADGTTVFDFYYTRNAYTITFDSKGGSAVGSITALYEAAITAPENPTKTGYTFKEWSPALAVTMPLGGQALTAVWTANSYEITYSGLEKADEYHTTDAHTYGIATVIENPTRAGYSFAGWIINNAGTAVKDLTLAADGYTADITLEATWTADEQNYTVIYYYENLDGEFVEQKRTTDNKAATDSTVTLTPEAVTGFTLNTEQSVLEGVVPVPEESLTLSVYYNRNAYTLTWTVEGVSTTEEYKYEQAIVYPEDPTKEGYHFVGWNPSDISTMPAEKLTLTAQFAADTDTKYTVIHKLEDLNADTYSTKETQTLYGITDTEVTPSVKTYEGFTAPTTRTVTIAADGSTQVVYEYTRNSYDVTIVATDAGLTNATASQKVEFEGTLNVSVDVANGYKFLGWTSDNEKVTGSNVASYTITMPASDVTLTAGTEIIVYDITYNYADGTLADGEENPATYTVETEDFTLNNPTKRGYTFLGWNGSNGSAAQTAVTVAKGTFGNLTYTANWALIPYSITYDLAGGSVSSPNPTQYYVTTADFTLNNPTKAGYTFTGWTGTDLEGAVETVTVASNSIGDRSYTATWEANDIKTVVNYYLQNIDDDGYTLKDTVNGTVKNDTVFAPEVKTYTGFVAPEAQSVKVENGVAVTIDYYYTRETHTVTLTAGTGISTISGAGTYRYGKQLTLGAEVLTGYTWKNWTDTASAAQASEDIAYVITVGTADIALTANATLDTYTITYTDSLGVAQTLDNPTSYNVHTEEIVLVNPEKIGYTFTGWTGTDLAGQTMEVRIPTGSTGNRSFVATWNKNVYTLTYDLAEGNLPAGTSNPSTYTVTDTITLQNPERVGYTFAGWSDGETVSQNITLSGATGDRHYTATWTANTDTKYTVRHYQMQLDGSYLATAFETVEFKDGVSDDFVTPAVNNYEGFTSPTAETVKVEPDGSTVVEYYYSRNQYTLTYVIAGSEDVVNTYYYGATLPEAPTAKRDGYTFSAWDITTPENMPAKDLTITALWNTVAYTITFNANGGNAMTAINYNIETAVTLPLAKRVGYDFAGWTVTYTDGTGNWASTIAENNASLSAGLWGNVTLTANWTARQDTAYVVKHMFMNVDGTAYDEFKVEEFTGTSDSTVTPAVLTGDAVIGFSVPSAKTVTIAADGSTVVEYKYDRNQYTLTWVIKGSADEVFTYYYDAAVTAKTDPVLAGHTFKGWSREIPVNMPAENINIVADFDIITYTITIDYNGAQAVDNKTTYTVETETFTLNNPTRDGYTFLGWEGTDNGEVVTIAKGSTGDRTYKAKWNADEQEWYVDVYYMTTEGKYADTPDESIENTNITDTEVSFDLADKLIDGFTADTANSVLSDTVPGTGTLRLIAKYSRNQYTVTYDFANGDEKKTVTTYYEAALASVADPTRTGYTFEGWKNSKGEIVSLPMTMPLNGETYTAQWSADAYTLTLIENGGTAVEDITYTIESTDALPTISRAGYFFEGWKVTAAGGAWTADDANYAAGTALKGKYGTATLTAQWTTVQYTLEFNTTHGSVTPASITYTVEDTSNVLPTPVRPGYTFTGWLVTEVSDDTQSAGYIYWEVGKTYAAGTKLTDTYGNAKFEAQWQENTYTVTADTENITYVGEETATVDQDYTATLTPHAGYTLPDTVTVTIGGEEAIVNTAYTYTVHEDGTATLAVNGAYIIGDIAIKVERNIITYTISYDYANATYQPDNATTYNVETAVTLTAPERTGYTFLGWTGSNGTTPEKAVTIPVGSTGNKEYTANWQADPREYTVEIYYMTTDGTYNNTPDKSWSVDSFTDKQVSYDIYSTETLLTGFSANESISTLTGTVPATGSLTLVAKYDRNKYALTVNGCEGITAATGTVEYYFDKEIVVDATVAMGYTWVEWKSADETVLPGSTDKKYTFKMPANAATLTAVATLDVYDITYDYASATEIPVNPTSYSVTTETFTLVNPSRVGYDFIGWTGTDLATPTMTVTIEKNSTTGDKSYTANWKAIEYTVTYDLDKGTAQGSNYTVYTIEDAAQTLTAPVKTGYTFLGWTGSNGETPETDVTIAGGTIGDLNFKANWSADSHYYTVEVRYMTTEGVYPNAADESEQILSETDANVSVTPDAPEGFTFDPNGSILSGTVDHEDKLVLKVYYSRNQYELTLVDGGDGIDSVNTKTTTVYYGADVEISAAVSNGYTFEKWTSDNASVADSTANPYTFKMPAGEVKLTATATLNTYKINYTLNDGTNDAANPATYTVLDTVVIKQPTRLGYTFTGWTGSYEGKDVTIAAGTTGDINLTANWVINTYTVSYDLAGGTLAADKTNPTAYNVTESFTLNNPEKVGYDFAGWQGTGIDGTQLNVTVAAGTTGNLAYVATWTARKDTAYTVNYWLADIPAGGTTTYTKTADSFVGEYYSDQSVTPSVPVYAGFATPVAQTKSIAADGSTVFNFYYARNTYTYTFEAIGYEDDVRTFYYDAPVSAPNDPVRNGYDFAGWNPVVAEKMPANNVVSVAQWTAVVYSVGYNLAGGTVAGSNPLSYTIENGFTLINPTRNGYDFVGWSGTGIEGTSTFVSVPVGSMGDRSYTAVWTPTRYEITYDLAGGTDNGLNPISYTIEDVVNLVNPTRVGYVFRGWTGTGIAGTSSYVTFKNATGDRSYTAKWSVSNNTPYTVEHYQQDIGSNTYTLFETESFTGTTLSTVAPNVRIYPGFTSPARKTATIAADGSTTVAYYYTRNNYTIYFDSNGGTAVASQTYAFGESVVAPVDPTFLGYTFAGWTPSLPETMTAGNIYVTADWKANSDTPYTVYHYYQDVDCVSYPDSLMEVEYCHGETGAIIEVATRDREGFTSPETRSIVIAADGSRTVRYYYTRNTYTVTFVDHNDNILDLQSVVYGLPATPPELADREPDATGHHTFVGWSEDVDFIRDYTTIKAMYITEAHDPGPDATCTQALICTVCGYEMAPANGHLPVVQTPAVEPTCTTPGNTADSVCSVCGEVLSRYQVIPARGHEIGSWYVEVPATPTSTGVLKRVCSGCDWSETHEIPVLSDSPVVSIDITTSGSQAYVGTSYQLVTEIKPSNAVNKQVLWESSDPSVASVTEDGFITSHKPGEVTFTVTTLDGLKTDSITINFYYSADNYNLLLLDLFACSLSLDGKPVNQSIGEIIRVKAGSTLAFTIDPTTTEYLEQGGYIFTANGSNVEPDANGVYYIYNVHENIEITVLPAIGKPEFDEDQQYDTDEVPEKSIFAKILAFFERIIEWFKNLFK